MDAVLRDSDLLRDLDPGIQGRLVSVAHRQALPKGDYLFLLGDHADRLYVVLDGKVELCLPLSLGGVVKDVAVRMIEPGGSLGSSAMVKPFRFTLSARAAEKSELAWFARAELLQLVADDPALGCALLGRLTELIGRRYLTMQALWGRELQRSLTKASPEAARPRSSP